MGQFRLSSPSYLYMKGDVPGISSPTYIEEGTIVGSGTAYDFEGPPNRSMVPMDDHAQAMYDEAEGVYTDAGAPTVKGTTAPPEGGASPFDPASGKTDSDTDADKAAADKKAKDDEAAKKAADDAKAKADADKSKK